MGECGHRRRGWSCFRPSARGSRSVLTRRLQRVTGADPGRRRSAGRNHRTRGNGTEPPRTVRRAPDRPARPPGLGSAPCSDRAAPRRADACLPASALLPGRSARAAPRAGLRAGEEYRAAERGPSPSDRQRADGGPPRGGLPLPLSSRWHRQPQGASVRPGVGQSPLFLPGRCKRADSGLGVLAIAGRNSLPPSDDRDSGILSFG